MKGVRSEKEVDLDPPVARLVGPGLGTLPPSPKVSGTQLLEKALFPDMKWECRRRSG